jgi:hypothetical protein
MKRKVTDLLPNEAILISNDADLKVLQEFENIGARWNSGDKATSKKAGFFTYPCWFKNDGLYDLRWTTSTDDFKVAYPATDFIGSEGEMERGITIVKQNGEVISAETKFDQAIKLLRDLADLQNGAPLEQHRAEWKQTMDEVYTFLNEHETRNTNGKI